MSKKIKKYLKLKDEKLIKSCKPALKELYKNHRKKYIDLFFYEKDIKFDKFDLSPLVKTNILRKIRNKYRANIQVFPLSGRFICTDFIISIHKIKNGRIVRGKDDVWGIMAYESPYIAKKAIIEKGDFVLDLATGSGIIAIFCADKARKVVATDINTKAINYARFNAILNNVEDKIEFRVGDMFKPVKGLKFDLIIWNGPTLPVPNVPEKYPIYCYGGPDGLEFTRRFIKQAKKYLKNNGRIQWLDVSVGSLNKPESLRLVEKYLRKEKFKVVYEERVSPSDIFKTIKYNDKRMIEEPMKNRPKTPLWIKPLKDKEFSDWLDFFKRNKFTHFHSGMYKVYPNKKFKVIKTKPKELVFKRMNYLPAEWHFLGYSRIMQQLKICESY